jgi:hypothetical protein
LLFCSTNQISELLNISTDTFGIISSGTFQNSSVMKDLYKSKRRYSFPYLISLKGKVTGIAFIDSTSIAVCHNKRIRRNKVFRNLAKRGKTTSGWFYGFKLHLIINDKGEILAFQLTPGNVADISIVEALSRGIFGKLFGDKGYISAEIGKKLFERGVQLFTTIKSNMKQKLMSIKEKLLSTIFNRKNHL